MTGGLRNLWPPQMRDGRDARNNLGCLLRYLGTKMSVITSVIVPTHNRPAGIAETIGHLIRACSGTGSEVIVVDDGSDPHVPSFQANVRLIRTPGVERSNARNRGATAARGEILIFVDDDMTVGEDFVRAHEGASVDFPGALCVGGVRLSERFTGSPFGRFRHLIEDPTQTRPRGLMAEKNCCTAQNMSIPREAFLAMGGFDPAIVSGEDQDFALRFSERGGRIAFVPEAVAIHRDSAVDLKSYCHRHLWGSRAMAPFLRRYPDREDSQARLRFDPKNVGARPFAEQMACAVRQSLSTSLILRLLLGAVTALEQTGARDAVLFPMYRVLLGLHLFRGFRAGLAEVKVAPPLPPALVPEAP